MTPRGILGSVFLVAGAAASWFLIQTIQHGGSQDAATQSESRGYYLKDAAILGTNDEGGLLYRVEASDIRHLPVEKRVALAGVTVRYSAAGQPAWSATSSAGSIDDESAIISLSGNVLLRNDNPDEEPAYEIQTETLEFKPRDRFASTDAQVRITQPGVLLTATGMDADLENEMLVLKAEVSGQFNP